MKKNIKKLVPILIIIPLIFNYGSNPSNIKTQLANLSDLGKNKPVFVCTEPYSKIKRGILAQLPVNESPQTPLGLDLRSYNLAELNLSNYSTELKYVTFDSDTVWPNNLPVNFSPQNIMDLGRDPGLGIRALHSRGITGKGVNIAIIDQALLLEHEEYKDNIMLYEKLHSQDFMATMHGAGVASIAAGKNIGVAPDAKLYYIAATFGASANNEPNVDLTYMAEGIMRVLDINKHLPENDKIRVISISMGFDGEFKGSNQVYDAIKLATQSGVFVITTNTFKNYGFSLVGLSRNISSDPNDLHSYTPGAFWSDSFYSGTMPNENLLLVPMDARTYASFTGTKDYAFSAVGGLSWTCPWLAGLYALCVQVNPHITIDEFIQLAFKTGDEITINHGSKQYNLKTVINPTKLIDTVKQLN